MSNFLELVAAERQRQVEEEGWSPEHDDDHRKGELAQAAASYATYHTVNPYPFPWPGWDKIGFKGAERRLVIAAALIQAEYERLQRMFERMERRMNVDAPPPAQP